MKINPIFGVKINPIFGCEWCEKLIISDKCILILKSVLVNSLLLKASGFVLSERWASVTLAWVYKQTIILKPPSAASHSYQYIVLRKIYNFKNPFGDNLNCIPLSTLFRLSPYSHMGAKISYDELQLEKSNSTLKDLTLHEMRWNSGQQKQIEVLPKMLPDLIGHRTTLFRRNCSGLIFQLVLIFWSKYFYKIIVFHLNQVIKMLKNKLLSVNGFAWKLKSISLKLQRDWSLLAIKDYEYLF